MGGLDISCFSFTYLLIHMEFFYHNDQLLEATARAVQPVLELGESGFAVADGLSNLLKVNKHTLFAHPIWLDLRWMNFFGFANLILDYGTTAYLRRGN